LGGSTHTVNRNTEALVVSSKEIGLPVNADEAKHMVMSCGQHAGQNHIINPLKGWNSSVTGEQH